MKDVDNNFKVIYSNCDFGLLNKKDELKYLIDKDKPFIIALTEVIQKNDSNVPLTEYHISDNYDMFLNKNPKRGTALYVDKILGAREVNEIEENFTFQESTWCTFTTKNDGTVLIGCIYRSPNNSDIDNDKSLFELLQSDIISKFDKICVMGDFNFPFVKWDESPQSEKSEIIKMEIQDAFLFQQVHDPTRRRANQQPTLDDWVLVNDETLISDIKHNAPLGNSDHDVLAFELNISNDPKPEQRKYAFNLKKGNYEKLREHIRLTDWTEMEGKNVENMWSFFKDKVLEAMERCIPKIKKGKQKKLLPSWMDMKTLRKIKKKHKMFKRYLKTKAGRDYLAYQEIRNVCTKLIKIAKKKYEKKIATEGKTNPKIFWKYIQERLKIRTGISTLKKADGTLASEDHEKAEVLNKYFASVFTRENVNNVPNLENCSFSQGKSVAEVRVTSEAVRKKLQELKVDKAQGPDLLPPKVLKELSAELALPLTLLFNTSLETGDLPRDWKTAEVTAIFKKGSKADPGNYRPVSLTCVACKVLESLVRDSVVSHFTDNDLYASCQHGFRKKRSCVTQLLQVMENLSKFVDENESIDIVYLDFRKAFDSVPHERLLTKLQAYGICGKLLSWIRGFLVGRTQHVRVGESRSDKEDVLSGIPQGSILGPILFTVFINDMPSALQSMCYIFADDTKILNKSSKMNSIQNDIDNLQDWSDQWNLYFNISKCHVLHIGNSNPHNEYTMKHDSTNLKVSECKEEKDLGVTFDQQLKFDSHVNRIVGKANQVLGMVKRAFTLDDTQTFVKLYKTFVRPHLEYANVIWCPYLKRQSVMLERVQRRATRLLKECKDMTYGERLKYLGLHSLKGRRKRGDLIQMFKIFHGYDDVNLCTLFTLSPVNITRNSEGKLYVPHARTNLRKFSFSARVINPWNALPTNVKYSKSINEFKNQIDKLPQLQDTFYGFDE